MNLISASSVQTRTMRRFEIVILVCMILGMVTAITVSVILHEMAQRNIDTVSPPVGPFWLSFTSNRSPTAFSRAIWLEHWSDEWTRDPDSYEWRTVGGRVDFLSQVQFPPPPSHRNRSGPANIQTLQIRVTQAGLPLRSVASEVCVWKEATKSRIHDSRYQVGDLKLPSRILMAGMIGNAIVYGLAWMLMLLIPRWIRRYRRVMTGRCPACAYDLRHNLARGCSECGWRRVQIG